MMYYQPKKMVTLNQSTFTSGILKTLTLTFITVSCICALVYMGHMNQGSHHNRTHHRHRKHHDNHSDDDHDSHHDDDDSHHDSHKEALERSVREVNNIHGSDNHALENEIVNNLDALKAKAELFIDDHDEKKIKSNSNVHNDKHHDDDHEEDDEDDEDDDDNDHDEDDDDDDDNYYYDDSNFKHGL
ncbi:unnamed protein product [Meganyctiphanes norvegica]|uniref:Uncharacterized protein n=1 Tax=Meganyctiphanes norvegica TaxID=48144 RepID=A0AAV2Q478_MEGNR